MDQFLGRIQAGVVYVNRRAGATTGAWPGIQPFGGWKGSRLTGKAGGGLLRPAVHAGAEPDHRRLTATRPESNGGERRPPHSRPRPAIAGVGEGTP